VVNAIFPRSPPEVISRRAGYTKTDISAARSAFDRPTPYTRLSFTVLVTSACVLQNAELKIQFPIPAHRDLYDTQLDLHAFSHLHSAFCTRFCIVAFWIYAGALPHGFLHSHTLHSPDSARAPSSYPAS
jgi:hypothetical protein